MDIPKEVREANFDSYRLCWAGAVGLLCKVSNQVDDETRDLIFEAASDWCKVSGWECAKTDRRVYVNLPQDRS